jgi:hypothetical protein
MRAIKRLIIVISVLMLSACASAPMQESISEKYNLDSQLHRLDGAEYYLLRNFDVIEEIAISNGL